LPINLEIMNQPNLFGEIEPACLSIDDAASETGTSTATIRNWIKTGYLVNFNKGMITRDSLANFINEIVGQEKLNARANKSQKDTHNHAELTEIISKKILTGKLVGENLAQEYENSLSESHKNKEGIYYTPKSIAADMLPETVVGFEDKLFLDPCCGGGNFIIRALEIGFKPENVFGFDTDPNAVAITKKRIFDKTGYQTNNITEGDFLEQAYSQNKKFDYIFTNPPWGKKISKDAKERYGTIYKSGKSLDTSSLFFFAAVSCLKPAGKLGFLLPESFFNISIFQDARNCALNLKIERLIDYDKAFKGLVTKAQAIILSNITIGGQYSVNCESAGKVFKRSQETFIDNPKQIINFWTDEESSKAIKHIFNLSHITLENNADWGLGIVTGNNEKYCNANQTDGRIPVYKGSDIKADRIKAPTVFIPNNLSLYQQVAPKSLYEAPEKLIYKFISSKLCFYCDTEKRYILNSANLLILKKSFPIKGSQLCTLLNSDFINWIFRSIFNTHKVLRGDLETIPIHHGYFESNAEFDEKSYLNYLQIEKNDNGTYRIKS
jgi:site-specific DNA-methyltransferase (adenine-specific)